MLSLKVCGESLRNVTHERAIQVLRQTPPVVKLVILREEAELLHDGNVYDTITVDLVKKPGRGLGFSIVGRSSGIFVSDVVRDCFLNSFSSTFLRCRSS
jgi:multiple PDZ domain protein